MSDDGKLSIVVIALLGNPFSPYYVRARKERAAARPLDYCALNVGVYRRGGRLWTLHERRVDDRDRQADAVAIGTSRVRWEGATLVVDIDERTSPFGGPLRGTVTFHPSSATRMCVPLDANALHAWWPVAPHGRIEVALDSPSLRFGGQGYHDANAGEVPLEHSFSRWTWSRARIAHRCTHVSYNVTASIRELSPPPLELEILGDTVRALEPARLTPLPTTFWRLGREASSRGSRNPVVIHELEDTPFYSRALIETRLGGGPVIAVHETLSLERLSRDWVRFLLPFRMGRS